MTEHTQLKQLGLTSMYITGARVHLTETGGFVARNLYRMRSHTQQPLNTALVNSEKINGACFF